MRKCLQTVYSVGRVRRKIDAAPHMHLTHSEAQAGGKEPPSLEKLRVLHPQAHNRRLGRAAKEKRLKKRSNTCLTGKASCPSTYMQARSGSRMPGACEQASPLCHLMSRQVPDPARQVSAHWPGQVPPCVREKASSALPVGFSAASSQARSSGAAHQVT